jgi:hypothetical protein
MIELKELSQQQERHIETTLERIRAGLSKRLDQDLEPSHLFYPEAFGERTTKHD